MMFILNDEELRVINNTVYPEDRAISKAQLKQAVEKLDEDCTEHGHTKDTRRSQCPKCVLILLEEAGM